MSKSQLKIDALNTGFERIVLLDEFQEEIDAPKVIKTPLGNYLVCHTREDTYLLSPEIFGAWAARRNAVGFAALDEVVEEVHDVQFCLRFASEIREAEITGKKGEPPAGAFVPSMDQGGEAEPEIHYSPGVGNNQCLENVVTEDYVCQYNRTPADMHICMGTTDGISPEGDLPAVHAVLYYQYTQAVKNGHVGCTNPVHVHVSHDRTSFYEVEPGFHTTTDSEPYKVLLRRVENLTRPKDPCRFQGVPVPTWSRPGDTTVFSVAEVAMAESRWKPPDDRFNLAITGSHVEKDSIFANMQRSEIQVFVDFAKSASTLLPGRATDTSLEYSVKDNPMECLYRAYRQSRIT